MRGGGEGMRGRGEGVRGVRGCDGGGERRPPFNI